MEQEKKYCKYCGLFQRIFHYIFIMSIEKNKKIRLGAVLHRLITEKQLTQKQLGDILGYSARTISDWEYNNTEPNIDAIVKLLKLYDISFEELIEN